MLAYRDLRDWLSRVEGMGQLRVIEGADPELEIGVLTEINARRSSSPAFLFDKIKGYEPGFRVLTGLLLTRERARGRAASVK
ncbi:MAG: UbiD family decarboxylase [Deltaproteobacteria bacterium]|nr:UbiD family decarboxylase [Deltaproteobacteria bacterium]